MDWKVMSELVTNITIIATCRYLQKQLKLYPSHGTYNVKDTVLSMDIKGHVQLIFHEKHNGLLEIFLEEPVQLKCRANQFSIHPNTPTSIQYSLSEETKKNMKEENVQLTKICHIPDSNHVELHLVYDKFIPIPLKIKAHHVH